MSTGRMPMQSALRHSTALRTTEKYSFFNLTTKNTNFQSSDKRKSSGGSRTLARSHGNDIQLYYLQRTKNYLFFDLESKPL